MKLKFLFLALTAILIACPLSAQEQDTMVSEGQTLDAGAIIIGHIGDAHSWHILDYADKQGSEHAVSIPLPVILVNEGHVDVFMSSRFEHGHADYKGYRLTGGGAQKEVIMCVDKEGSLTGVKPLDLSITKTAAGIIIAVIIILVMIFAARNGYKKRGTGTPKGWQSLIEMLVVYVRDEIARPMIGEKKYEKYLPYLLTLFFFVFTCNLLGLIPLFPAGANITGNIAVTATLALITFIITNLSGNKHYWKEIFNNPEVPAYLKIFPLMPLVELVGVFTKPIVLMIRLFANMTAGHVISLGFVVIIFIISNSVNMAIGGSVAAPISLFFQVFMGALDCLVSYIQAYVFTTLTALYIGMAVSEPEHENA